MLKIIVFIFFFVPLSPLNANGVRFSYISGLDTFGQPYTVTTSLYNHSQLGELRATLENISPARTIVCFNRTSQHILSWLKAIPSTHQKFAILMPASLPDIPYSYTNDQATAKEPFDKVGAITALYRTANASFFWIVLSDFNTLQSLSMLVFQSIINYSFTYKGYKLDMLNYIKNKSTVAASKMGFANAGESKIYSATVKYASTFSISFLLGMGFMGIVAWEDIVQEFNRSEVYRENAFVSIGALFATGSWNNFLSDQKLSPRPMLSDRTLTNIYRFNGLVKGVAFPLLLNGDVTGTVLIGTMGITGLIMMYKGESILSWINLQRLAWKLRKCASQ